MVSWTIFLKRSFGFSLYSIYRASQTIHCLKSMDQIYLVFWSDLRRIEEWDSFAYNCLALWIRGNNLLLVLWIASFLSMFDITSSSLVWTYWPLLYHDQFSLLYQKRHVVMTYLSSQYHISFFRLQLQSY